MEHIFNVFAKFRSLLAALVSFFLHMCKIFAHLAWPVRFGFGFGFGSSQITKLQHHSC
jgi:hypothetical protein